MKPIKKITSGIYLVVDPSMDEVKLFATLSRILNKNIAAVQVWDNFSPRQDIKTFVRRIASLCKENRVSLLINNRWEILKDTSVDGVHFDSIPEDLEKIKKIINRKFIIGITCGNEQETIRWGIGQDIDYFSFCSVFPSTTSKSCKLVDFKNIRLAREMTSKPIFLAGGIKPENIQELKDLRFDGIAVISGIMNSDQPDLSLENYITELNAIIK